MASVGDRTLIHYSKGKIPKLSNNMSTQRYLMKHTGKPMGFWYAYGNNWQEYIISNPTEKRTIENTTFRYEFTLPEEIFVTEVEDATPDTILQVSKANLDSFMQKFVKEEHRYKPHEVVKSAFEDRINSGKKSRVVDELAAKNEKFKAELPTLTKKSSASVMKKIKKDYPSLLSSYTPSVQALQEDHIINYEWVFFWEDVSNAIGGIEFQSDLLDVDEWDGIWLSWSRVLSIKSGVIFRPTKFRDGILQEQLKTQYMNGGNKRGGKQTRRKRRGIRKTKRHSRR
jgi:hypothetical protein